MFNITKWLTFAINLLIILMAFTCNKDYRTGFGRSNDRGDSLCAIPHSDHCIWTDESGEDLIDYGAALFSTRVIVGKNHVVGMVFGDPTP